MIGRFAHIDQYQELLSNGDLLRVVGGGLLALAGYVMENALAQSGSISTVLILMSVAINGVPVIVGAIKGLLKKQVNVDELLSLAIIACLIQGEYFTAAVVSCIMVLGAVIEEITAESARKSIQALVRISPQKAVVISNEGEKQVPVEEVAVGDILLIKSGEQVPVDALVTEGHSTIDESAITGEAMPVEKHPGSHVYAGTFNHNGVLKLQAEKVGRDTTLGRVIQLVSDAENHKPESVSLVNRFAKWFTPAIMSGALLAWFFSGDFDRAVTVLIVGCPCALILAVPTAIVATIARAARAGILIKGGQYVENAGLTDTIFFDKTGTLTQGNPHVDDIVTQKGVDKGHLLFCAASVEVNATHPLARAVVQAAREAGISPAEAKDVVAEIGLGIRGMVKDQMVDVGSLSLYGGMDKLPGALRNSVRDAKNRGATLLMVYEDKQLLGFMSVSDQVRPKAGKMIEDLCKMGCGDMGILSGDHEISVAHLGNFLGIRNTWASLKPHEKLDIIKQTQQRGQRVMFVGDGINDAPALAVADVGVAMAGQGTQVALETADIVLMGDHLSKLPFLVTLSRRMLFIIKLNIGFGLIFNLISVLAGASGLITPIMGAVVHNLGSVLVVLFSASMGFVKE